MATVLIVDDEERFRTECAGFFKRAGWETFTAADGEGAIAFLAEQRPQVDGMILDRSMVGKSGDDVIQWLYDHQVLDDVCVIMLTAYSDYESAVDTLQAGAWQYMRKPVMLSTLLAVLAPGVAIKRCHRRHRQILSAENRNGVVDQVRRIIVETIAPDSCKVIFLSPADSAEMRDHGDSLFVKALIEGKPYIAEEERDKVRTLQPILEEAGSLMAVPVSDIHSAIIGVLDIESRKEKAFSSRWVEVLRYGADLIGTFEAVRDARQVKEIALINQELRHRLATHVHILGQQVTEARRMYGEDQSPDSPLNVIANHVAIINAVMDDLSGMIREHPRLNIVDTSPFDVLARVSRGDRQLPVIGPEQTKDTLIVRADCEALRYCLDCIVQNAFDAIEARQRYDPSSTNVRHYVKLNVDHDPQWVRIRIEDTGIGFTPKIGARLFIPLFSTKTHKGHDGIGLYSVKRMIQEMGGRVDAESPGEFSGAIFTVSLRRA